MGFVSRQPRSSSWMGVQHRVIQHGAAAHVEGTEILTVLLVLGATALVLLHM